MKKINYYLDILKKVYGKSFKLDNYGYFFKLTLIKCVILIVKWLKSCKY